MILNLLTHLKTCEALLLLQWKALQFSTTWCSHVYRAYAGLW